MMTCEISLTLRRLPGASQLCSLNSPGDELQPQAPTAAWLAPCGFSFLPAAGFPGPLLLGNCQHQSCAVPEDEHVGPFYLEILLLSENSNRKSECVSDPISFWKPLWDEAFISGAGLAFLSDFLVVSHLRQSFLFKKAHSQQIG